MLQHVQMSEHDLLLTCRIIGLAQGYQQSSTALSSQHLSPAAALDAAAARSQQGSYATSQSVSGSATSMPADRPAAADPSSNRSAAAPEAAPEQGRPVETSSVDTQRDPAEASADASDQSTAKHRVGMKDALQASQNTVKDWAAGRLSLDYPPDEGDNVDSMSSEPLPDQGSSMQGASSAAVLHSVLSSIRQVLSFLLVLIILHASCQ